MISVLCYSGVRAGREMGRAPGGRAGVGRARGYEDVNTRRMNYARLPQALQNGP